MFGFGGHRPRNVKDGQKSDSQQQQAKRGARFNSWQSLCNAVSVKKVEKACLEIVLDFKSIETAKESDFLSDFLGLETLLENLYNTLLF